MFSIFFSYFMLRFYFFAAELATCFQMTLLINVCKNILNTSASLVFCYRTIESLRVEKTFQITMSNCKFKSAKFIIKPCPSVPHIHVCHTITFLMSFGLALSIAASSHTANSQYWRKASGSFTSALSSSLHHQ